MTPDMDAAVCALMPLFRELDLLQQRAVQIYAPQVNALVRTGSRDSRDIEGVLDGLLSFCGHPDALALFKRLCRHYWTIDPAATACYIDSYRQMWDSQAPEA